MDLVVVDADVFSYFTKHDSRSGLYKDELRGRSWCLSFMSVAEPRRWALSRAWGAERRRQLEEAIGQCTVLLPDDPMATTWADIMVQRAKSGKAMACGDCWIAACAVRFGLPLVTHNARHYSDIPGLVVVTRSPRA